MLIWKSPNLKLCAFQKNKSHLSNINHKIELSQYRSLLNLCERKWVKFDKQRRRKEFGLGTWGYNINHRSIKVRLTLQGDVWLHLVQACWLNFKLWDGGWAAHGPYQNTWTHCSSPPATCFTQTQDLIHIWRLRPRAAPPWSANSLNTNPFLDQSRKLTSPPWSVDSPGWCEHEESLSMFCLDDLEPLCKQRAAVSLAGHTVYP